MFFSKQSLHLAHNHSNTTILTSDLCGCFYCLKSFHPSSIDEWTVDEKAICPHCGIDSVMGNNPTKEFLVEMHNYWFEI